MKKKLLFSAILALVAWLGVELILYLGYFALRRHPFPVAALQAAMKAQAAPEAPEPQDRSKGEGSFVYREGYVEAIHPYLGFVRDPDKTAGTSPLGLLAGDNDPLARAPQGAFTVAVFGGSFAAYAAIKAQASLEEELRPLGQPIRIVNAALAGYKQPQQLILLCYLLSLGAHFDAVVNLDGFNEVALPQAENQPKGVNPFYPRSWYYRVMNLSDQEGLRLIGEAQFYGKLRQDWAQIAIKTRPHWSLIRCILWRVLDAQIEGRIAEAGEKARTMAGRGRKDFAATGPTCEARDPQAYYEDLARSWMECSILMDAACKSHGIQYFHFLQPNQYLEGSKPLNEEEMKTAFDPNHEYRPGVVAGYPLLIQAGQELIAKGVAFQDLTQIYADHPETLYADACCHPNAWGYEIVARAMGRDIREAWKRP